MNDNSDFENKVLKFALENAYSFKGKANSKALIGKLVSIHPEMKKDMGYYMNIIENICKDINSLSLQEQENKLKEINPDYFVKEKKEKKIKKEGLQPLPNHEGKVTVRFAPAPSGYLHLGHAFNIIYNYEYLRMYGGDFILRIEDTNPENISIENYDRIIEDVKWLTEDSISKIYYQSDRIDIYYKYLRTLIETGSAYVCECEPETFKSYNDSCEPCPHRNLDISKQKVKYENFFNGQYKEGDAIIRFKADLKNKNPALRDFPIARIKDASHTRIKEKYSLWPMYNFCAAVDDSLMEINYIIRGKDGEINGIRQDMIKQSLGLKRSPFYHIGRTKFTDLELSKTKLSEQIKEGKYSGWDDPRVPTLVSFRKRGFQAEAFRKMIVSQGISKRDSKITEQEFYKSLNYYNKQLLEKKSNRAFFVHNPKKISIINLNQITSNHLSLLKHPDFKDRGFRTFDVKSDYLIDSIDFNNLEEGDIFRLMHFGNFKIVSKTDDNLEIEFLSKEYDKSLEIKRNIHFIPSLENEKCKVIMQDNSIVKGFCEPLNNPKIDTSFQFERFGFVRFDHKDTTDDSLIFYFTHR